MSLPSLSLKEKSIIITGSTKGIGHGIAVGLAQAGANVVITSRNQSECDKIAKEIGERYGVGVLAVATDVTNSSQVQKLVEASVEEFGQIDVLVNNAGTAITQKAEDITEADWDRVTKINQKAYFFVSQAVGKEMIKQNYGKIINVSSIMGLVGDKFILPYCASKGAVVQMTRALALEWAKYNIQVNALCPGYVLTSMNKKDMADERISQHIINSTPMRRYGKAEDMQGPAVFLASSSSDYMTGQTLVIDGGWTAQ